MTAPHWARYAIFLRCDGASGVSLGTKTKRLFMRRAVSAARRNTLSAIPFASLPTELTEHGAIIAASMSTADSQLLVATSSFTSDIYKPIIRKKASSKEVLWVGRVVVLGTTGRNFAAGMSGGVAYVWNKKGDFDYFCNMEMVELSLIEEASYRKELHELIRQHYLYTGSKLARTMLDDWGRYVEQFIQVVPIEYKKVLQEEQMKKLQQKIADMQRDY